jgi:hopanoid biosynthesis associated protein HpnK
MKQLIVNGDDFGLASGANRAIIQAWQDGILTSTSLMMGGQACAEAVALAKANPGLQVGLHLTLLQGRALIIPRQFPSITDRYGYFNNDPVMTGMRFFFIKPLRKQIRAEIIAQIEAFQATGLPLSHIDGHLNIHMHPTVFDILVDLMPQYGIKTFRLSRERLGVDLKIAPQRHFGKAVDAYIFGKLAERCGPMLDRLGIGYTAEVKGLLHSGAITEEYLLKALDVLQEGISEIYCHPGHPDEELAKWMPGYRHDDELAALTSQRVRETLRQRGISLRNYRGDAKTVG